MRGTRGHFKAEPIAREKDELLGGFPDVEEVAVEVGGDVDVAAASSAIDGGTEAADSDFAKVGDGDFDSRPGGKRGEVAEDGFKQFVVLAAATPAHGVEVDALVGGD